MEGVLCLTRQKDYSQLITAGKRRISLSQNEHPYMLSNIMLFVLKPYTHKEQKQTQQVVLTCANTYMHTYNL